MANIKDYLGWRGDVPFHIDSFNQVDNLILSELAYVDFDGIEGVEESFLPLNEVCKKYFEMHTEQEIMKRKTFFAKVPFLLNDLASSKRYENLKIGYYKNLIDLEDITQFSAVTYEFEDMVYVAFRGTDDTIVGWKEDFYFSFKSGTSSQIASVGYLNKIAQISDKKIHVGGHSKGGNLAIYGAMLCEDSVKNRIEKVWGNDSPGFSGETIKTKNFKDVSEKIELIVPKSSVIGMLMDCGIEPCIVKSNAKFLLQHDGLTWQVYGNKFVREKEISEDAIFVKKAISSWLEDVPNEHKKKAADGVFYCLESNNITTLTELKTGGWGVILNIIETANKLPKQERNLIFDLIGNLREISRDLAFNELKDKIKNRRIDK